MSGPHTIETSQVGFKCNWDHYIETYQHQTQHVIW